LLVAVAALSLVFPASRAAQGATRDDLCEAQYIAHLPASTTDEIVLPVIVHYMKSTLHKNEVWKTFTQRTVTGYFKQNGTIDKIWRQAGIRLFLHRIEHCAYDPVAMTGQVRGQPEEVPDPVNSQPALFDRVVQFYNHRAVPGLDLYLWWELGGLVVGYSVPYHLSDGSTRTGAVWVDTQCVRTREMAARCERLVAHEIGHFLGLCHRCRVDRDPVTGCTSCSGPQDRIPNCASRDAPDSIMRSRFDGTKLDTCEIRRSTGEAQDRIRSSNPSP
jgi:hypothetical protein